MSNPTTPFNWQMPTNTDLVTDLPADFEVFGQAVASSMADLLGGTTGQILSKATNADMDFTWIANDQGDITGVTAGTGISGGGTSGDVTITNSMATAIDAKGDLIGGTGADAFARLAVGTNGQVLTADSTAATGLAWATPSSGGMTLLNAGGTTFSGSSITSATIPTTYKHLYVTFQNVYGTAADFMFIRLNSDSGANYTTRRLQVAASSTGVNTSGSATSSALTQIPAASDWSKNGCGEINIPDYTLTSGQQIINSRSLGWDSANYYSIHQISAYNKSAAITSITLGVTSGTFSGGKFYIYGVN